MNAFDGQLSWLLAECLRELGLKSVARAAIPRKHLTSGGDSVLLTYRAEGDGYKEHRGCLEVETEVATFLATHLGLHADERRGQTGDLRTLAEQAHGPAVILGDLNADPESPELGALRARFLDAGCDAGPTIPSRDPARRIDYRLLPPAWRVVEARVVPTVASDHRPLLVVAETGE